MITVENIKKSFKSFEALKGIDLHVEKGKVMALLGPNGAGKTTLVRIMSTLLKPDSGEIMINGIDALKDETKLRKSIGLTGQYSAVDEGLTGYENLVMFGRLYHLSKADAHKRAVELLEDFSLTEAAHRFAKTYSGGMRRRLDLAASLIVHPPVIFLDEPTTGLDPAARQELWQVIKKLVADGATVLLTTQYLEEADYLADTITVINHGEIIAQGTADELKRQMGGSVLEVTIKQADKVVEAKAILEATIGGVARIEEEHRHLQIDIEGDADLLVGVIKAFDEKEISISDIQLRRPTLDDVFIKLTSKKA